MRRANCLGTGWGCGQEMPEITLKSVSRRKVGRKLSEPPELGIPAFHWFTAFVRSLAGDDFMYGTWAIVAVWCLYVGVWNVLTIRKPEVLEGFAEKREDY